MLKNNYIDWKSNIKLDPNWAAPIDSDFIPHILPILASITLLRDSATNKICPKLTYNNISGQIKTPNGSIDAEQLKALVVFTGIARRSTLLPKTTQTKYPQYGIYTPLVMYAHKLYNNVGYDQWSTNLSQYLLVFLGSTLYDAYKSAKTNGKPTLNNIKELRKTALTYKSGVKMGQQDKATAHRCNLLKLQHRTTTGFEDVKYTKYAVMSYLQLWICNAELRNDAMILDLLNWGNTPKAIDAVVPRVEQVAEKSDLDAVWEI